MIKWFVRLFRNATAFSVGMLVGVVYGSVIASFSSFATMATMGYFQLAC